MGPNHSEAADLLTGLTPAQQAAVISGATPLCIVAAAGAGKTRVLTRRIAYRIQTGSALAKHTLALTFTRKAAGELQARLHQLRMREPVSAGTFHSVAAAQLQRWWADRGKQPPSLLERKSRLLGPLAAGRPGLSKVPVSELAGHIEWAKARLVTPERFEAEICASGRPIPGGVPASAIASLYGRYEDEKVRRGLVDFDDLLARCADAIESDPAFAGAQRWRWRHLFVDEFQDVNPLQHRLLLAWLGSSTDLCVVGDHLQAVYGWNGADPDLLLQVPKRWPSAEVLYLDENHRCSPQIVSAGAAVLGDQGQRLKSAGADGPRPEIRCYPSEHAEASGIVSQIHRARASGRSWSSMAVLTRTNAQLVPIQRALGAASVPVWAPSQAALLDDAEARELLRGIRAQPRTSMQVVAADLTQIAEEESGAQRGLAATALADLARGFLREAPGSLAAQWIAWLPTALADHQGIGPADSVTICSFHRAKGLEWDEVWIAGVEQGLVPISRATSVAAEDEERRLFYVALTRASYQVHLSWARERTFGARSVRRDASEWLEVVRRAGRGGGTGGEETGPADSTAWRKRLREQRTDLRSKRSGRRLPAGWPEPDEELLDALRAWRSEVARAAGVPAYVVFHDVTLAALASMRPSTTDELLGVPGLGPVKAGRYGPSILSLLADRVATG